MKCVTQISNPLSIHVSDPTHITFNVLYTSYNNLAKTSNVSMPTINYYYPTINIPLQTISALYKQFV